MRVAVVPAAGRGSRLGGPTPKPFVEIGGANSRLIDYVVSNLVDHVDLVVPIVAPGNEWRLEQWPGSWPIQVMVQPEPTGMLAAVQLARPFLSKATSVAIVWSDQVGLSKETISKGLQECERSEGSWCGIPVRRVDKPYVQYIWLPDNTIEVRETRVGDRADPIGLCDVGMFLFKSGRDLVSALDSYGSFLNSTGFDGELNFLPFLRYASKEQLLRIVPLESCSEFDLLSVNTAEELQTASRLLKGATW